MSKLPSFLEACDRGVFVTGTDTDVGKTHVACQILREWREICHVAPLKPVECGPDRADSKALLEASGNGTLTLDQVNPEWYRIPASPVAAAVEEKREMNWCGMLDHFEALAVKFDRVVVEGAGGWFVPMTSDPRRTVADFAKECALPVVVVAADRLGVLNHTLLTVRAIEAAGLRCAGVILNPLPGVAVDPKLRNLEQLREFLGEVPVVAER